MWATSQQLVDNRVLFTAAQTTHLQDVVDHSQGCGGNSQWLSGFDVVHPQSTRLITVINSLYKHPQITMNNVVQGAW